ncbi:MAG: beta strand repeat-containing protein, partial [Nitrosopumilaceae archaeon]
MSLIVLNLTASPISINDLGLEIPASSTIDLILEEASNVALSVDLVSEVTAGNITILDPLDDITPLSIADSITAIRAHNDTHFRIRGGTLDQLDDVSLVGLGPNDVIQNNGFGTFVNVSPSSLAGFINLDDLGDVDDSTTHTLGVPFVFVGDGTNLDVTSITDPVVTTVLSTNFLMNTTDSFDSGTLTIASGATVNFPSGSILTIQDGATAIVITPTGGFSFGTQIVNKDYVDSVAAGLDWKESADVATITDIGGTFSATGGTGGNGEFTSVDLTNIDGLSLVVGDRVVLKDQTTGSENGIYVVTTAGALGVIERAPDHNSASEVTASNAIFVERGTVNADKAFVITTNDPIIINTTSIAWANFASITGASSSFGTVIGGDGGTAVADTGGDTITFNGTGIDITAIDTPDSVTFVLNIADLSAGVGPLLTTDEFAVNDGGTTLRFTFQDMLEDLDIPFGITGTGIVVQTAPDVYTTRTIIASTGISVLNGDGVAGNPTISNTGVLSITLTQPAAGLTLTNTGITQTGAATSIFALANDLLAVEGLTTTGIAVRTAADTWTTRSLVAGTGISITNVDGVAGNPTISNTGVTSVGLSAPSIFAVSGSPVTTTGTLTFTLNTQTANTVFAGPASGGAATPTFRTLVAADLSTALQLYKENPSTPTAQTVTGTNAVAIGQGNTASATDSHAEGNSSNARLSGAYTDASGSFTAAGDAQYIRLLMRNITTNATTTDLFLDGSAVRANMQNNSVWTFRILIAARRTDATGGGASYQILGHARRDATAASTVVGGVSVTTIFETNAAWV